MVQRLATESFTSSSSWTRLTVRMRSLAKPWSTRIPRKSATFSSKTFLRNARRKISDSSSWGSVRLRVSDYFRRRRARTHTASSASRDLIVHRRPRKNFRTKSSGAASSRLTTTRSRRSASFRTKKLKTRLILLNSRRNMERASKSTRMLNQKSSWNCSREWLVKWAWLTTSM